MAGDNAASKAIARYRGLCKKVAGQYLDRGVDFEDLEQECLIALWRATESFDPIGHPSVKFHVYASVLMHQACRRALGRERPHTLLAIAYRPAETSVDPEPLDEFREEFEAVFGELVGLQRSIVSAWLDAGRMLSDGELSLRLNVLPAEIGRARFAVVSRFRRRMVS